jgi:hypothetical protein
LREKVSPEATDEGCSAGARPLIRPAPQATFSRKGRRNAFEERPLQLKTAAMIVVGRPRL